MPLLKSSLTSVNNQVTAFHTWITSLQESLSSKIPRGTHRLEFDIFCSRHFVIKKTRNEFLSAGGSWVRGRERRGGGGAFHLQEKSGWFDRYIMVNNFPNLSTFACHLSPTRSVPLKG